MKEIVFDKSKWKKIKLGAIADDISVRVDNPSQSEFERFVGLEHFISGDLKIKNWSTTESLVSSTKAFKSGDILFARRNAYLRRASLVEFDGVCSGDAFVLRENNTKIIPGFLAFIVNSEKLWDYANANAAGTMSKRVKWRDLANFEFSLPPIDQQEKLAELLWAGDDLINKSLTQLNIINIIYLAAEKDIFESSDSQNSMVHLTDVAWFQEGPGLRNWQFKESGIKVINVTNILEGYLDLSLTNRYLDYDEFIKTYKHFECDENDIVVASSGNSYCKHAVIKKKDLPLMMNTSVIRFKPLKDFEFDYLNCFLSSRSFKKQIDKLIEGGAQPNFGPYHLRKVFIPNLDSELRKAYSQKLNLIKKVS